MDSMSLKQSLSGDNKTKKKKKKQSLKWSVQSVHIHLKNSFFLNPVNGLLL